MSVLVVDRTSHRRNAGIHTKTDGIPLSSIRILFLGNAHCNANAAASKLFAIVFYLLTEC